MPIRTPAGQVAPRRVSRDRAFSNRCPSRGARHHASVDVSFGAVDRDHRVAAGVLAGGIAYRFFLWTFPFTLVIAGVLGLIESDNAKSAA